MDNKIIKKTYFISNDLITGERFLAKSIEYDFQGNVKEFIRYEQNGVQLYRSITERYKNNIASVATYMNTEHTKYYYAYDEYIYDEKDLLIEKVSFGRMDFISKVLDYDEEDYNGLERPDKIIVNAYVNSVKYKYDEKSRLIRESSHTAQDDLVTATEYFYYDDEMIMIIKHPRSDSDPITTRIFRSNDRQHRISNTYDKHGALQRTEHVTINPDGSKIINKEMISDGISNRDVYYYDKEGNLFEERNINDFVHKCTRRSSHHDQSGLMKGYCDYVSEKGMEKLTKQIEYEFVHDYFLGG